MTEQRIKLIKGTCTITVEPHQVAFWKAEGFAIVEPDPIPMPKSAPATTYPRPISTTKEK